MAVREEDRWLPAPCLSVQGVNLQRSRSQAAGAGFCRGVAVVARHQPATSSGSHKGEPFGPSPMCLPEQLSQSDAPSGQLVARLCRQRRQKQAAGCAHALQMAPT